MAEKPRRSLISRVVEAQTSGLVHRMTQKQHGEKSLAHFTSDVSTKCDAIGAVKHQTHGIEQSPEMTDAMRTQMTHLLMEAVAKCSRQKMRFVLMHLRRMNGVDSYMTFADLTKTLQENGITIPPMASDLVQTSCSDQMGVDSEKVWKLLMDVHGESDRDSVRARKGLHLRTPMISVFADHGGDRELLEKVESQLLAAAQTTFDYNGFKNAVLDLDKSHRGYVPNTQLLKICRDNGFPVTGESLKTLLIRCDDDSNGKISHREFFVFVDKAMNNVLKVNPRLFARKDDSKSKKRPTNAGQVLEDGTVTVQHKTKLTVKEKVTTNAENATAQIADETLPANMLPRSGSNADLHTELPPELDRKNSAAAISVVSSLAAEESSSTSKKKKGVSKMKGLLSRKKGSSTAMNVDGVANLDPNADAMSLASSTFSSVSRAPTSVNRELSSNGLTEKTIRPVVRKVNEQKLVLWPPDEYFDAVTPKIRLPELEWLYGYSGFASRNNVFLLKDGLVLMYFTGFVVVLLDLVEEKQRVYLEHDGKIECAAVTKSGQLAATGQAGQKEQPACIRLWNTDTLDTLYVLKTELIEAVVAVTFSKEDDVLVAIDSAKPCSLSVWLVENGQLLCAKSCTDSQIVCGIIALQAPTKEFQYLLYGRNLMEVWRIVPLEKRIDFVRQCVFGQIPKPAIITCLLETPFGETAGLQVISGDSDGNVILWSEEMRPKTILQNGNNKVPVFTLCSPSASVVLCGSRDGSIVILTVDSEVAVVTNKTKIPDDYGGIRIMLLHPRTDALNFYLGTTSNALLHISSPTTDIQELDVEKSTLKLLTAGHFDENTGCLSTFVTDGQTFALTAAMDGNINCYDLQLHHIVWRIFLKDAMVSAVDAHVNYMAVGTADAKLKLYQMTLPQPTQLLQARVGKGRVTSVKFSPDGSRLAVGSEESEIYLYRVGQEEEQVGLTPVGKFDKHDYPVVALDWSKNPARDNHLIVHSNSTQLENFLFDAESMDFLEETHFYRNVKWATQTCMFGFAALTSACKDGSLEGQIITTDVSATLDLVAVVSSVTRSSFGLYSYPNANVQSVSHAQLTASDGISAVRFCYVNNQLYLLCAHNNGSLTQWSLR